MLLLRHLSKPYSLLGLVTAILLFPSFLFSQNKEPLINSSRQEAYELAWSQNYPEAIDLFKEILEQNPGDLDARLGLSYTYAWNKSFSIAKRNFRLVLEKDPQNTEALKGMAYTALWSGNYEEALKAFEQLPENLQKQEEIAQARGFAYIKLGKHSMARRELIRVNSLKRKKELNLAIQSAQAKWEAWLWGGLSRIDNTNRTGIRAGQITFAPDANKRLWIRMDNSLTLDNSSLTLRDTAATAYWVGGNWNLGSKWQSQIEVGRRQFLNNSQQNLVQLEQVFFYKAGSSLKLGTFLAFGEGLTRDLLLYGGLSQELTPNLWTEQQIYLAWSGSRFDQYRGAISAKYRFSTGIECMLGLQAGEQFVPQEEFDTRVWGVWGQIQLPLLNRHWIFINARQERTPNLNFFTLALGGRFRIE